MMKMTIEYEDGRFSVTLEDGTVETHACVGLDVEEVYECVERFIQETNNE